MHYPSLGTDIGHGGKEGFDQRCEVVQTDCLVDLFRCETAIVMGMEAGVE